MMRHLDGPWAEAAAAVIAALEHRRGAWTLTTPKGDVRAGIVVDAAGQWAPKIARLAGADLPIAALEHHYVVTDGIPTAKVGRRVRPNLRLEHVV